MGVYGCGCGQCTGAGPDDVSVFAGTPTAAVSSTLRYSLKTDNAPLDQANPGDVLTYRTAIKNTGTGNAADAVLTEPAPTNTTFVGGSVKTSRWPGTKRLQRLLTRR